MKTIRISEEVWNEIAKRGKFGETPDQVLVRVFNISSPTSHKQIFVHPRKLNGDNPKDGSPGGRKPFVAGGFDFPHDTEFRMKVHGEYKYARIYDGILVVDNNNFSSVSPAAGYLTGNSINGWDCWECRLPNEKEWRWIKNVRRSPVSRRIRSHHFAPPSADAFKAKLDELKAKKRDAKRTGFNE